ncbi:MAG: VOC family protein [Pseudomonadota bacterium]
MPEARLEHVNVTVSNPQATAAWLARVFGWETRWEGQATGGGYTIHVGEDATYLAIYTPPGDVSDRPRSYGTKGGLNHWAVVVDDLDTIEARVRKEGFEPCNHGDYEPGRRFYFHDGDGIEIEVVSYA